MYDFGGRKTSIAPPFIRKELCNQRPFNRALIGEFKTGTFSWSTMLKSNELKCSTPEGSIQIPFPKRPGARGGNWVPVEHFVSSIPGIPHSWLTSGSSALKRQFGIGFLVHWDPLGNVPSFVLTASYSTLELTFSSLVHCRSRQNV